MHTGGSRVGLCDGPDLWLFILVGWDRSSFVRCLVHRSSTDDLLLLQILSGVVWQPRGHHRSRSMLCLLGPRLCFFVVLGRDLFVSRGFLLMRLRVIMRTGRPAGCFVPLQGLRVVLYTWSWLKPPPVVRCWPFWGGGFVVVLVAFFGCRGFCGVSPCVSSVVLVWFVLPGGRLLGVFSLCFDCF